MSHLVQHQSRRNHAIVAVVGEKITGGAWMIIENGDSKFTEEEKRNLVVREYTSEEIEKNKQDTTSVDWERFHHLFDAWVQNYRTNSLTQLSSNTSDASKLEQYSQLLQMDKKIIPGIIVRLSEPKFIFCFNSLRCVTECR